MGQTVIETRALERQLSAFHLKGRDSAEGPQAATSDQQTGLRSSPTADPREKRFQLIPQRSASERDGAGRSRPGTALAVNSLLCRFFWLAVTHSCVLFAGFRPFLG